MSLHVLNHPAAAHVVTLLREKSTIPERFRYLCGRLAPFLVIEATRHLPTRAVTVETPLETCQGTELDTRIVVIPILRAGLALLQPILDLLPDVSVGYVGMERDEVTAAARQYYSKLPPLEGHTVLVADPMLATGGSAEATVEMVSRHNPREIIMISIVAAPEGVQRLESRFPNLKIFTAALDRQLNERRYILPGLGDFGDRLYGT